MVELIWKGKQTLDSATFMNSKIPTQHLCIYESFAGQSTNILTNPPLNSTPG